MNNYLIYNNKPKNSERCGFCGIPDPTFIDITFNCGVCDKKCSDDLWEQYKEDMRKEERQERTDRNGNDPF